MKPLYVIVPLAILASGWFFYNTKKSDQLSPSEALLSSTTEARLQIDQKKNPLATAVSSVEQAQITKSPSGNNLTVDHDAPTRLLPRPSREDIDLTTIAATHLTDAQFKNLENRIKQDPSLLADILAEYRYNTDPERAKRLAALVGKLKDPQILSTATELAYSSDFQSKKNGLELLSRIQPHNSEARDISIELLGVESDPDFLVSTMNVFATPGTNTSESQKQMLLDNVSLLSTHQEESVRAHSIALLGRWAKNDLTTTPTLIAALSDTSAHVRARAATAVTGTSTPNQEMIASLFALLENPDEVKTTRQTAMLALQRMQLSQSQQTQFLDGQRALRTRQITQ